MHFNGSNLGTPRQGHFWFPGPHLNNLGRDPLGNVIAIHTKYQGPRTSSFKGDVKVTVNALMRGAVVEWLEQLGYGAESRRIA